MIRSFFLNGWFERNRSPFTLALLTVFMVVATELRYPYVFLQDDNLYQNLPYYVHNYRALLSGEIPLFNFHQFLGTPVLSCIQSAAFYPPNYVALFLSKLLLGHYWGTMEFIATFHLILAAIGFFGLMQHFGLKELSCCFGALAWTFCGFVMTGANSWIQIAGYAAYLPWILLYSLRQTGKFDRKSFLMLIVLRVLALLLGYPPLFIYSVTFDILTVTVLYLVSTRGADEENEDNSLSGIDRCGFMTFLLRQGLSYLCVVLISAPLLLPAMHQIAISANRKAPLSWEEYSRYSYKLSYWLNGLFTPIDNMKSSFWYEQQFYSHIGWLTLLFCIAALWLRTEARKQVTVFLALAIFSFLWASDTFVTRWVYHIPLYNRQRWPFKLVFFTNFYLIMISSFGFNSCHVLLNRFFYRKKRMVSAILAVIFFVHLGNFLALHLLTPPRLLTQHFKAVDKPPFDEPLKEMLSNSRIVTVVQADSSYDNTIRLLGFNYATLLGLYHFAGYETLVSEDNLKAAMGLNYSADFYMDKDSSFNPSSGDLDYLRKWGVKWYVLDKKVRLQKSGVLEKVYDDGERVILHDGAASPLVYWQDNAGGSTGYAFATNSVRVDTKRESSGQLIVNVLHNPFFAATIDGTKTDLIETADKQMLVNIPPGRHRVVITYKDPYFFAGLFVTGSFLILTVVVIPLLRLRKSWRIGKSGAEESLC